MKKTIITILISALIAQANIIQLTPKQEENWQIKTKKIELSKTLPLGKYMLEATIPPYFLRAITLAFDVQVTQLYVSSYQYVDKNMIIADVSSPIWIDAQTNLISNKISYNEYKSIAYRKNRLCKEGIIPEKECVSVNSQLKNAKAKLSASKAVLSAYGADVETISNLEKTMKIKPALSLFSPVAGTIIELNAQVGKSVNASTPLVVL